MKKKHSKHPKQKTATRAGVKLGLLISTLFIIVGLVYAIYSYIEQNALETISSDIQIDYTVPPAGVQK